LRAKFYAGIILSLLSPLILPIGLLTFKGFLILYSYQATYVLESDRETFGLLYWEAVNYLFAGIYTMDLCRIGLFALQNAVGPTTRTATLLLGIAMVHSIWGAISPLLSTTYPAISPLGMIYHRRNESQVNLPSRERACMQSMGVRFILNQGILLSGIISSKERFDQQKNG
jgi:hypothetical protein